MTPYPFAPAPLTIEEFADIANRKGYGVTVELSSLADELKYLTRQTDGTKLIAVPPPGAIEEGFALDPDAIRYLCDKLLIDVRHFGFTIG